jgi:hypothetical protein
MKHVITIYCNFVPIFKWMTIHPDTHIKHIHQILYKLINTLRVDLVTRDHGGLKGIEGEINSL